MPGERRGGGRRRRRRQSEEKSVVFHPCNDCATYLVVAWVTIHQSKKEKKETAVAKCGGSREKLRALEVK